MLVLTNAAIAIAGAIALTVLLTSGDRAATSPPRPGAPDTAATTPAEPSAAPALVAWVRANVSSSASIVADDAGAALLDGIGFRASTDYANCGADRFLLVTTSLRQRATGVPALAGCLASSQPIAAVGQGATAAELRAITTDPDAAAAARQQALTDRRLGGTALTQNPAITIPGAVRQALLAGDLDLRAETVLVTLARRTAFRIDAVRAVAAEARAGMPARTVLLRLPRPVGTSWFRTHVSSDYRPSKIVRHAPDTEWLTWSFRIAPPPVLK